MRQSHLEYFCKLAEQAEPNLKGTNQNQWLDRLEEERDNMRAAWDWAIDRDPERALGLTQGLLEFWMRRGYTDEAREKLARLVVRTEGWGVSIKREWVLLIAARVALRVMDYSRAMSLVDQALAIALAVGSKRDLAIAMRGLGIAARGLGHNRVAHMYLEGSLGPLLEMGEDWFAANVLQAMAILAGDEGNHPLSQKLGEESIAAFRRAGDLASIPYPLHSMGLAALVRGDYERAALLYGEVLELAREYRNEHQVVLASCGLGIACLRLGDVRRARAVYEDDLGQARHQGQGYLSLWLICMSGVLRAEGNPELAARLLGVGEAGIEAARFKIELAHRVEAEHIKSRIRAQLGEAGFASGLAKGRALTLEEAVMLAVSERD